MKNYLASYWDGISINSLTLEMDDDYIPYKDNCHALKRKIIEIDSPERMKYCCVPNGGYVNSYSVRKIRIEELQLVAISNLDI